MRPISQAGPTVPQIKNQVFHIFDGLLEFDEADGGISGFMVEIDFSPSFQKEISQFEGISLVLLVGVDEIAQMPAGRRFAAGSEQCVRRTRLTKSFCRHLTNSY